MDYFLVGDWKRGMAAELERGWGEQMLGKGCRYRGVVGMDEGGSLCMNELDVMLRDCYDDCCRMCERVRLGAVLGWYCEAWKGIWGRLGGCAALWLLQVLGMCSVNGWMCGCCGGVAGVLRGCCGGVAGVLRGCCGGVARSERCCEMYLRCVEV